MQYVERPRSKQEKSEQSDVKHNPSSDLVRLQDNSLLEMKDEGMSAYRMGCALCMFHTVICNFKIELYCAVSNNNNK